MKDSSANTLLWLLMIVSIASLAETSCSLVWTTNSEFNHYNDSSNLTLKTNCSHAEFTYYSFKLERWRPLNEFEPASDQSISYTNHSTNRKGVDIRTNKCVYHIRIHITEENHEHLQGVVLIRSRDPDYNYCYLLPRRYTITTPQSKCNCNQETTGQTTATDLNQETTEQTTTTASTYPDQETTVSEQTTAISSTYLYQETAEQTIAIIILSSDSESVYLDQETMISSSCKVLVERMLLLFCSLICLFFCHNTKF